MVYLLLTPAAAPPAPAVCSEASVFSHPSASPVVPASATSRPKSSSSPAVPRRARLCVSKPHRWRPRRFRSSRKSHSMWLLKSHPRVVLARRIRGAFLLGHCCRHGWRARTRSTQRHRSGELVRGRCVCQTRRPRPRGTECSLSLIHI